MLLAGSPAKPGCARTVAPRDGAARSAAFMCAMCSSVDIADDFTGDITRDIADDCTSDVADCVIVLDGVRCSVHAARSAGATTYMYRDIGWSWRRRKRSELVKLERCGNGANWWNWSDVETERTEKSSRVIHVVQ